LAVHRNKMSEFKNKVIWITGASSGIGEALAYEVSKKKPAAILLSAPAQNAKELETVSDNCVKAGVITHVIPFDLAQSSEIKQAFERAKQLCGTIDIVFHNGGISQRSTVEETPIEVDERLFKVNFWGAVELTKLVLPGMLRNQSGHFVVSASIAGLFGFSLRSAYSASKHALCGYFESLRCETHDRGIKVTLLFPGRVNTNISLHALTKDGTAHGIQDHGQRSGISVEKCAKEIVRAVKRNKKTVLIGGKELLMVHFKRFIPPLFYYLVNKVKPT
jgi:dehydrogenase/reductase SDR family member 7B